MSTIEERIARVEANQDAQRELLKTLQTHLDLGFTALNAKLDVHFNKMMANALEIEKLKSVRNTERETRSSSNDWVKWAIGMFLVLIFSIIGTYLSIRGMQ